MILNRKKKYLQIALNSNLGDAYSIIRSLPKSDRIIIEAGTPLIKEYGTYVIRQLVNYWSQGDLTGNPYIVADLKREALFAQKTGRLEIAPMELSCVAKIPNSKKKTNSNDPFFDSFFKQFSHKTIIAQSYCALVCPNLANQSCTCTCRSRVLPYAAVAWVIYGCMR